MVSEPLVVQNKLANRLRQLFALPPAFETPCAVALAFRRASTCGLDCIGGRTEFVRGDVRDPAAVRHAMRGCGHVFHLAAQVAVTTSMVDPRADFAVNLQGTL